MQAPIARRAFAAVPTVSEFDERIKALLKSGLLSAIRQRALSTPDKPRKSLGKSLGKSPLRRLPKSRGLAIVG